MYTLMRDIPVIMTLRIKEHVNFLKDLIKRQDSFEFIQMSHLKTSAIYWSLTASILLDSLDEIYPPAQQAQVLEYLEGTYKGDGGFGGNDGAHDSHLLFTLSAVQIMVILLGRGEFPSWFNVDLTVKCMYFYIVSSSFLSCFTVIFIKIAPSLFTLDVLGLQNLQSGAFSGDPFGEIDSRFSYCAIATLSLLNQIDRLSSDSKSLAISFLLQCRNFDGGFGAVPGSESHGGNIFCCISALKIVGYESDETGNTLDWLVWRQLPSGGFNGRPEKLSDVCYSWWILSSLASLSALPHIDQHKLLEFILECQDIHDQIGGFADRPGDVGDVFHTLFGLAGLALLEHPQITVKIDPLYCLPSKYL